MAGKMLQSPVSILCERIPWKHPERPPGKKTKRSVLCICHMQGNLGNIHSAFPPIPSLPELNHGETTNGDWWVQGKRKKWARKETRRSPPPSPPQACRPEAGQAGREAEPVSAWILELTFLWKTGLGILRACLVAQTRGTCLPCRRRGFDPWVRKIPWSRKQQPTPGFLPGESHGQRSLVGYSRQGLKELDTTEQLTTMGVLTLNHTICNSSLP